MLQEIGSVDKVANAIKEFKGGKGRLMGFGHRVYRSYDPRGKIIKQLAYYEVFEVTGKNPLIHIALKLKRIALQDDEFRLAQTLSQRRLLLGHHLPGDGLPATMFPVLFAIPRLPARPAQAALKRCRYPEQKTTRPRQLYVGEAQRSWTPIEQRPEPVEREEAVSMLI